MSEHSMGGGEVPSTITADREVTTSELLMSEPGRELMVSALLTGEPGRDDIIDGAFFQALRGHPMVAYELGDGEHEAARFPLICSNGCHMAAVYSIPLEEACALLPEQQRLSPVLLSPQRAAIVFSGSTYRRSGLGAYNELGVGLFVTRDGRKSTSLLSALSDVLPTGRYPRLGMFMLERVVDHRRACAGGEQLYGWPEAVGAGELSLQGGRGVVAMNHQGRLLARFEIALNERSGGPRRLHLPSRIYSISGGRLIAARYEHVSDGYLTSHGEVSLSFGEHPRLARFGELSLSPEPVQVRILPRLNTIGWQPEDLGPLPDYRARAISALVPETILAPEPATQSEPEAAPEPSAQPDIEPGAAPEPQPVVTSVEPNKGSCVGGDRLTIEGDHFGGEVTVRLGTSSAELVAIDGSRLSVITPPRRSPGLVDIEVVAASGASARLLKAFRYQPHPPPKILAIAPHRGRVGGGTELSIEGSHFAAGVTVVVGGKPATGVRRLDDATLEVKTPPGKHGKMVDVSVENPDGHKAVATRAFLYDERYG